jgi:hypothetical protein
MASQYFSDYIGLQNRPDFPLSRNWLNIRVWWLFFKVTFLVSQSCCRYFIVTWGTVWKGQWRVLTLSALRLSWQLFQRWLLIFVSWQFAELRYFSQVYPLWVFSWRLAAVLAFPWQSWDVRRYFWWVIFWTCGIRTCSAENKFYFYLSDKAVDVSVSEVVWQYYRLESLCVLDNELLPWRKPFNGAGVVFILGKW